MEAESRAELDLETIWMEEPGRFRVARLAGKREDYEHFLIHGKGDPSFFVHLGDGSFREDVILSPGEYSLTLSGFGYQGSQDFQVRPGELSLLELEQDPLPSVRRAAEASRATFRANAEPVK